MIIIDEVTEMLNQIRARRAARVSVADVAVEKAPLETPSTPPYIAGSLKDLLTGLHPDKPELYRNIQSVITRLAVLSGVKFSMEKGPWLAGGCLRQALEGNVCRTDYDIFFSSKEQYEQIFKGLVREAQGAYALVEKTLSTDKITDWTVTCDDTLAKVQLIHGTRFFTSPSSLLQTFDFTCCQIATDGVDVTYGGTTVKDVEQRKLIINRLIMPVPTLPRIAKYGKYGYTMDFEQSKKFLQGVVENPARLKEDALY